MTLPSLTFNFPLLGLVNIHVNEPSVFEFSKRTLQNFSSHTPPHPNSSSFNFSSSSPSNPSHTFSQTSSSNDLLSILEISNPSLLQKFQFFISKNLHLSQHVSFHNNTLQYSTPLNTHIHASIKNDILTFIIKKDISHLKSSSPLSYSSSHGLFYESLLFPIFALYSLLDNYYLLHASTLYNPSQNHCLLFVGLNGVGKSTLSNSLHHENYQVISDNFSLFNGSHTLSFNMPIRLEKSSPSPFKTIYTPPDQPIIEVLPTYTHPSPILVNTLLYCTLGNQFNLHPLNSSPNTSLLLSNYAPEINAANQHASIFHLLSTPHQNTNTSSFYPPPSYLLTMPYGKIQDGLNQLKSLLHTLPNSSLKNSSPHACLQQN